MKKHILNETPKTETLQAGAVEIEKALKEVMKKLIYLCSLIILFSLLLINCDNPIQDSNVPSQSLTLFNRVLYYDGYAAIVNELVPEGMVRVENSRYAKKIPQDFISGLRSKLVMDVIVEAACDNYDRIGKVFISLINNNEPYNQSNIVSQIEIARFITPFMDKNKSPNEVPYKFEIDNIAKLLKDSEHSEKFDFWMEFDIFGVPYAANNEIAGCAGRNDVFFGTLKLTTSDNALEAEKQYLIPIASFLSLNNYKDTDEIGKTIRSLSIETSADIQNAKLYLITSNHGSNSGGEEYNRRDHYVYFGNNLIDTYKPGGKSCEPFRVYNTQRNGIYGNSPRTDADWASWNNWCPGDVIPTRIFELGDLVVGTRTFKIEVPDAKFVGQQGDFPLSAYIQGEKK
jgi:hypothetical protein